MTVEQLTRSLKGQLLVAGDPKATVKHVVASDLMSDVLVNTQESFLLVTSLASDQVIRTADLVGAIGVVLVNNKQPPSSLLTMATQLGISLVTSPLPKYEACLAIGSGLDADV
jgi:hypothetical protein